jgi:hypothetical protein
MLTALWQLSEPILTQAEACKSFPHLRNACNNRLQDVVHSMYHLHTPGLVDGDKGVGVHENSGFPVKSVGAREAFGVQVHSEIPILSHLSVKGL